MHNLVLLLISISGLGVFFTFTGFVFLPKGNKQRPTPKLVMQAVAMFTVAIIMLFIV